jgi:hypothetical protein
LNILQNRVQRTIAYLNSDRGKTNWSLNIGRGFSEEKNLFAAIQTATHLIKYETIIEVLNQVRSQWQAKEQAA